MQCLGRSSQQARCVGNQESVSGWCHPLQSGGWPGSARCSLQGKSSTHHQDIFWFLSCRPVQRPPCRRQGGQVQCTDVSSVWSQGGAQSCVGSAMEALTGPDPAICPAQAVIRAQALQTTQPPPLQSMENVVSVSSTAKASKDDLEMSKVGADCPGWSVLGVARQ